MELFSRVFGRKTAEKKAYLLYVTIANHARQPLFYTKGHVADTLDGRFDVLAIYMPLVLMRLNMETDNKKADDLGRLLQEVMFANLDQSLREIGVGDLGVGPKVKKMAEALFGRQKVYEEAFAEEGEACVSALKEALARNLYRGEKVDDKVLTAVAEHMVAQKLYLQEVAFSDLWKGQPRLLAFEL